MIYENPNDYLVTKCGNYKKYNLDRKFLVLLDNGEKELVVIGEKYTPNGNPNCFFTESIDNRKKTISVEDIKEILQEVDKDFSLRCKNCWNNLTVDEKLNGETICSKEREFKKAIDKFKTRQNGVYKYSSLEELEELFQLFDNPEVVNEDLHYEIGGVNNLNNDSGLMCVWYHTDDYGCEYHCVIIEGGVN